MPELITNNRRPLFRGSRGRFRSKGGRFTVDTLSAGLANFEFKMREEMEELGIKFCQDLIDYAKKNAPWEDRTGDARAGLDGQVESDGHIMDVTLFHTVDYGVWLEVRWGGKFAIIIPTVEKMGSKLLEEWNGLMSEIYFP